MQYTKMDKLGISVSKLGFGCMRFQKNEDGSLNQEIVNQLVKEAYDSGINYFDTAYAYTNSEEALGKAIKQLDRSKIYIADKMPFMASLEDLFNFDKLFETSLQRLDVDYIDFYLMHAVNRERYNQIVEHKAIEWAEKQKALGKIRYLGFSIHADDGVLKDMLELTQWDFVQIQYNYLDLQDKPGQAGYNMLCEKQIPVVIMEPLKGGLLSDISDQVAEPFAPLGKTPANIAFRWLIEQPMVTTILSGMNTMEQLQENIATFSQAEPLSQQEHVAIEQVKQNIERLQKVTCTGCGYCMPCPSEVKIPSAFRAWNLQSLKHSASTSGNKPDYENVHQCTECGACLSLCPQGIDIPGKLRQLLDESQK